MDDDQEMMSAHAGYDQAISRLRNHVAGLVEGRLVHQETVQ